MSSPVAQSYRNYLTMNKAPAPERIRFEGWDEETAVVSKTHGRNGSRAAMEPPPLARSSTAISEDNVSLRPGSRRSSMAIEPATMLPIQYRTM